MPETKAFANGGLLLAQEGGVATLTITNPARKNALSQEMWQAVPVALAEAAADKGLRVLVLRGGGEADFSAGADISEFAVVRRDAETARAYEADNSAAFAAVRNFPLPVIAAIRGICFGGAFGLAAAADLRIAEAGTRFCIPPAKLGLAYPADAIGDILASLGHRMTRRALFTGEIFGPEAAMAAGFLEEIANEGGLDAAVASLAGTIAANAPLSIRATKRALAAAAARDPDLLHEAAALGAATFESRDYAEGRAAFAEKRKPVFTGS